MQHCWLCCKSVLQIAEHCTGIQTCQDVGMLNHVSSPPPASPTHFISEVLFWDMLLPPSRSWNSFYGVLIAYSTVQKGWILHYDHRLDGTALGRDHIIETSNSVLPQPVIAAHFAALWVAGWCPINCCSPGLADNIFRNPVQKKRAGRLQGSRLPHPRGMQCRCYTVMVPLEIYSPAWRPCNDISLRAFQCCQ